MDNLADFGFPIPLFGKPTQRLTEKMRHAQPDGIEVMDYVGTDGCQYREKRFPNGQICWEGFKLGTEDLL